MGDETPEPAQSPIAPFRIPDRLDITNGNVSENFRRWKRQMDIYLTASGVRGKNKDMQVAVILHCAGPNLVEVYNQFVWDNPDDKDDPDKVFQKIQHYCNPRSNEVIESHRFWCLQWAANEPFDVFLTELRNRADRCNFGTIKDRLVRDKIIFSTSGKLQERLLKEEDCTLDKTVKICQAFEQSVNHMKEIQENSVGQTPKINKVRTSSKTKTSQYSGHSQMQGTGKGRTSSNKTSVKKMVDNCDFCGGTHERDKSKCPAYGKTCTNCKGRNHFKRKCKKVHNVTVESDDTDDQWLNAVNKSSSEDYQASAVMKVNDLDVRFQIDSAADINTINQKFVRREQVEPTKVRLRMWNKTDTKPLGETTLPVYNTQTDKTFNVKFVVVPNDLTCLLGLNTIQEMGLVTINNDMFISAVGTNISDLGDLGEASLKLDPEVTPKALPCRKIPIAIQDDVKREIDLLVKRNILIPVSEPTQWVSQMAVVRKPNGNLRICIDPQALNSALIREHYKLPVLDDVLPKLSNARLFSKVDVKEAYWHVRLDEASSLLTTMIGRFRWARLPFGLKVSSEIFQRRLNEAIGDLAGTFSIADDILVAGCGANDREAQLDNDAKLNTLYKRCEERKIILNDAKKEIGLQAITFHGHRITRNGVKMDNKKVETILNMPAPEDVHAAKRFCGIVQYLAKFLPDLASMLEPIRALTRQDIEWNWSPECDATFNDIKQKLVIAPVLAYFDPKKTVTVQVDSSQYGLGAVLLQDGKLIEYASRLLSTSERNWAQIEKESLSILFGLERFDQYTYARPVIVQNDHKPLAAILKKPLNSAPKRLQDIMVRLGRYDFEFEYVKGTKLVLADALSRAGLMTETETRSRILKVDMFTDIPDARLQEVRIATENDFDMKQVILYIQYGWPNKKTDVPESIRQYFDFRDVLSFDDGIVLKGEAIVIPPSLRDDMKSRLHKSHLAYESMLRRAKGVIFWTGMSKDIERIANKPNNAKEPLKQSWDGGPWDKIGSDLFEIDGRHYLITVDYHSNFIEVDYLSTITCGKVIGMLKKQFARFGIPKVICTDGGPQYSSREFATFTAKWGINHVISSPNYPQANGKPESAVKIVKQMMSKCIADGSDQFESLLEIRNTPRQDTGLSPAEMFYGRKTRSMIPCASDNCKTENTNLANRRRKRKETVKRSYDRRTRPLSKLSPGQNVYFQKQPNNTWKQGKIVREVAERSYELQSTDGAVYRRNRAHIRPTEIDVKIHDAVPDRDSFNTLPIKPDVCSSTESAYNSNQPVSTSSPDASPKKQVCNPEPCVANSRPHRTTKEAAYLKDYVRY